MKKVLALLAAVSLMSATAAFAAKSIQFSKHNLGSATGGEASSVTKGNSTQICIYCHAPHGAALPQLLWNRTNPQGTEFTLYQIKNGANDNAAYSKFSADSTSLFCMSCHDGTIDMGAITHQGSGAFQLETGGSFASGVISGSANLGKNLTNTHPVNFPVSSNSQSDLYIAAPEASAKAMGNPAIAGMTATTFPLFAAGANVNSLECGSCHAVHDSENRPFLRFTMQGSALCLGCHNK